MSRLRYSVAMSLDGFVAGLHQSVEQPLGIRGELLHEWLRPLAIWRQNAGLDGGVVTPSTAVVERTNADLGAIVMGRNMFGGGPGPWADGAWKGWWGDDPPYHLPVFVLTHHARAPLQMLGGTTFIFVTEGIEAALDAARLSASPRDIAVAGGASVAKQYLAAGLLDEVTVHLVPVFLGDGIRLFDDPALSAVGLEQTNATEAPGVTHLTYRVVRGEGH